MSVTYKLQHPIAVTGLGLACSLGTSPDEAFDAIAAGRSGLGPMPALEQTPTPDKGGGQARPLPDASDAPREIQYLRHVVRQALQDAGPHFYDPSRVGAVMGTTLHGMRAGGRYLRTGDLAELRMFPAGSILDEALRGLGVEGARLNTCSACSSGLSAVALGLTILRAGYADLVIVGGYDAVSEYVYAGFDSLRLVAAGPPRPFCAEREGMKVAEGYAALVLEDEHHARSRGARVRGYITGYGESADAHHLTQPHPTGEGARAAIAQALQRSELSPDAIHLVSAHATSTPGNDASEYAALSAAFGARLPEIPVVAFKSQLGHTLGGAGGVELVLSVLARERGVVPPTLNSLPIDAACPNLRLNNSGAATPVPINTTLNLSLGFGGANTCVIVSSRKPVVDRARAEEPVITGVGVVLPDAVGNDKFVALLREGRSRGGPIHEDAIAHLLNTRRVRRMSDYSKTTLAATALACTHAGVDDLPAFAADACVILGTMHGSSNFCDQYYSQIVREGIASANPALFAEGVPNAAAAQLSLMLGVRGGCQTIIGSRTAGLDALALAAMRIRQGDCARAFVGAAEEHCDTVNRATAACDPGAGPDFGAGAVTLILESLRAAEARRARILAAIDLGDATSPEPEPDTIVTALGGARADQSLRRDIDAARVPHWSLAAALPETFSIGPLAALAALILAPRGSSVGPIKSGSCARIMASDAATGVMRLTVQL